jgi:hypothetical protein
MRAEENVVQGDIFLKSCRATVPGTQQIIYKGFGPNSLAGSRRSIHVKPFAFATCSSETQGGHGENTFSETIPRFPPSKVRCHGKISEIDRDAAICDDRYLRCDLGSRYGDPRHKVRPLPPAEAGC